MIGQTPRNPSSPAHSEVEQDVSEVPATEVPVSTGKRPEDGLDPTRYGDWEKNGRCIDF